MAICSALAGCTAKVCIPWLALAGDYPLDRMHVVRPASMVWILVWFKLFEELYRLMEGAQDRGCPHIWRRAFALMPVLPPLSALDCKVYGK